MFPYFFIFFLVLIFFVIGQQMDKIREKSIGGFKFLSLSLLVCLAAYRGQWVGTDTFTYLGFWDELHFANYKNNNWLFSEPLFILLQHITRYIADETFFGREIFLGTISALVCYLTFSTIDKVSENKFLSLIVFLFLGFYTFHFNGARQAIAIALFFYSIKYILNGNLKKYLIIVFLGFLFHKTMLITVPFYYIFRRKFTPVIVILVVLFTIVAALSLTTIVEYATGLDERYKSYANTESAGGGLVSVLFFTVILIWLYVSKKINKISVKLYDISLLGMLIAVCVGWLSITLSLNPSGILRLSVYFTQFMMFSLPMSIFSFSKRTIRDILLFLFFLFSVIYFYMTTSSFSGLSPYQLALELPF